MADKKISALDAATTPLAGTEVLPIVQSNATKKVSVANLTDGRALSATSLTLTTGDLVIGTSGKGIDFAATAGTGISELLNDYEQGVYTATLTPGTSGSITLNTSYNALSYTKIGSVVFISGTLIVASVASPVGNITLSLPFVVAPNAAGDSSVGSGSVHAQATVAANVSDFVILTYRNTSSSFISLGDATSPQNDSAQEAQATTRFIFNFFYPAA